MGLNNKPPEHILISKNNQKNLFKQIGITCLQLKVYEFIEYATAYEIAVMKNIYGFNS
jgi:hypothetical protein